MQCLLTELVEFSFNNKTLKLLLLKVVLILLLLPSSSNCIEDRGNDNWLVRYEKQSDGTDCSDKVRYRVAQLPIITFPPSKSLCGVFAKNHIELVMENLHVSD